MATDEGANPWDAPDPAQLRITATPGPTRRKSLKDTSPSVPREPVRTKGIGRPTFSPKAAPVKLPTDAPKPPAMRKAADTVDPGLDAPPIPRPRHPRGAPAPAVVDTRAPAPRMERSPGWHDAETEMEAEAPDAVPQVTPWAVRVGVAVGVGALLLAVGAIGWVVGNAIIVALTAEEDVAVEVPVEPNVPAFRGIGLEGSPGEKRTTPEEEATGSDISPQRGRLLPAGPFGRPSATGPGPDRATAAPVNTQERQDEGFGRARLPPAEESTVAEEPPGEDFPEDWSGELGEGASP